MDSQKHYTAYQPADWHLAFETSEISPLGAFLKYSEDASLNEDLPISCLLVIHFLLEV